MLYVYDKKEDIPKDKKIIYDVEAWFSTPKESSPIVDGLLRDIEKGTYYDAMFFIDRFGGKLYWKFLSTGCKAAILIASQPDWVIDVRECGDNVFEAIIRNKISGNILVNQISKIIAIPAHDVENEIWFNGKVFSNIAELSKWMRSWPK